MEKVLKLGLRVLRRILGEDSTVENSLKKSYMLAKSRITRQHDGDNFICFWPSNKTEKSLGIYIQGSCDLVSVFSCQPLIKSVYEGTCCILREGAVWDSTTSLILQSSRGVPEERLEEVRNKLNLDDNYFKPSQLFSNDFIVKSRGVSRRMKKDVIIMSIGPDVIRTLYRHREYGFLVDPGGWWFNQEMSNVLKDLSTAKWFRKNFENIGRINIDQFRSNISEIIIKIRETSDSEILIFNVLSIEPGSNLYNYSGVKDSIIRRACEFNLALIDLSRSLGFSIVNIDRVLKRIGVDNQVDYAHFPPELYSSVAEEVFNILKAKKFV